MPTPDDHDIDEWIEQLAGRSEGPPEPRTLNAVLAARAEAERRRLEQAHGLQAGEEHALQRLRFRLKHEGLLKRPTPRWMLWLPAAAAAVLVAVVGVRLLAPAPQDTLYAVAQEEPPRYRGAIHELQVPSAQTLEAVRRSAAALDALGAQPRLYAWQGSATLDFDAAPETLAALHKELAPYGLPPDALRTGPNRLVFPLR